MGGELRPVVATMVATTLNRKRIGHRHDATKGSGDQRGNREETPLVMWRAWEIPATPDICCVVPVRMKALLHAFVRQSTPQLKKVQLTRKKVQLGSNQEGGRSADLSGDVDDRVELVTVMAGELHQVTLRAGCVDFDVSVGHDDCVHFWLLMSR